MKSILSLLFKFLKKLALPFLKSLLKGWLFGWVAGFAKTLLIVLAVFLVLKFIF